MNENNSIRAKPSIPPSSIIDDCGRYSGRSMTRSECVNKFGSIDSAIIEIMVLSATKGIAIRLIFTISAIACCLAFGS